MASSNPVFKAFIICMLISTRISCTHGITDEYTKVIVSFKRYLKPDCVYFVVSSEKYLNCRIVKTQRYLSDHGILSGVMNTTSVIDNKLLTSCNKPMYAIFDAKEVRGRFKMLAELKKMSGSKWLLFLKDSINLEEYFLNIDIPFDCEFIVAAPLDTDGRIGLTEVYRVAGQFPLQKFQLGSITLQDIVWPRSSLYFRRNNLNGAVFKTSVNSWPPYACVRQNESNKTVLEGFAGLLWNILERHMNFEAVHKVPEDRGWGNKMENGSWDGVIGAILRNEVDMSSFGMTITPDRFEHVAFTKYLFNEEVQVYIRLPNRDVFLKSLLLPFSLHLWSAFIVSAVGLSAILALLYKMDGESMKDTIFHVFVAMFCQQGSVEPTRSQSKRIIIYLVSLLGIVVLSSYSSLFVSILTNFTPKIPFTTLSGLLDDGTYSLGMTEKGWILNDFENANATQYVIKQLYNRHIAPDPENIVQTLKEGFQRVCQRKYAYIVEDVASHFLDVDCDIISLPNVFAKKNIGLAFPKYSPYVRVFDYNLLKLRSAGILQKLYKETVYKMIPIQENKHVFVSFYTVIPIFSLALAGMIIASFVLALELLYFHIFTKNINYLKCYMEKHFNHGRKFDLQTRR